MVAPRASRPFPVGAPGPAAGIRSDDMADELSVQDETFLKFDRRRTARLLAESPSAGFKAMFKGRCAIGAFSYVGAGSAMTNADIGRYCSIAPNVVIGPASHPTDRFTSHLIGFRNRGPFGGSAEFQRVARGPALDGNTARTRIGNDVWIGEGAVLRRGVQVGDGAIIGAGSVVVRDVAPYAIVGGVPARLIRSRFDPETTARFLALRWWDVSLDIPELGEAEYADPLLFLDRMEALKDAGRLAPLRPGRFRLTPEGVEPA